MQYTEQELSQLIKTLEVEFSAHIAGITAEPTPLVKAEDESKEKESKDEKSEEKESEPKSEEVEAKEAKSEEAPADKEEAPKAPIASEDESGYDAEDIAHMDQMYMSMSKAELLAHHDSCVRALDAIGAEHIHQAPAEAAPAPEMDKCGDMSMAKSEQAIAEIKLPEVTIQNPETEMLKSEVAASKAKAEELQKSLDTVSAFLTQLVKKAPQGKAITSYEQVAKSESTSEAEPLTKSEIDAKLLAKSQDPKLNKSDRDAINAFYLNKTELNTIIHLLK